MHIPECIANVRMDQVMGLEAQSTDKVSVHDLGGRSSAWAAYPFKWSFSNMDKASTAMQATISCDICWPCVFHTSHKLGPRMSMT